MLHTPRAGPALPMGTCAAAAAWVAVLLFAMVQPCDMMTCSLQSMRFRMGVLMWGGKSCGAVSCAGVFMAPQLRAAASGCLGLLAVLALEAGGAFAGVLLIPTEFEGPCINLEVKTC